MARRMTCGSKKITVDADQRHDLAVEAAEDNFAGLSAAAVTADSNPFAGLSATADTIDDDDDYDDSVPNFDGQAIDEAQLQEATEQTQARKKKAVDKAAQSLEEQRC